MKNQQTLNSKQVGREHPNRQAPAVPIENWQTLNSKHYATLAAAVVP
jgi:hypothetical protein